MSVNIVYITRWNESAVSILSMETRLNTQRSEYSRDFRLLYHAPGKPSADFDAMDAAMKNLSRHRGNLSSTDPLKSSLRDFISVCQEMYTPENFSEFKRLLASRNLIPEDPEEARRRTEEKARQERLRREMEEARARKQREEQERLRRQQAEEEARARQQAEEEARQERLRREREKAWARKMREEHERRERLKQQMEEDRRRRERERILRPFKYAAAAAAVITIVWLIGGSIASGIRYNKIVKEFNAMMDNRQYVEAEYFLSGKDISGFSKKKQKVLKSELESVKKTISDEKTRLNGILEKNFSRKGVFSNVETSALYGVTDNLKKIEDVLKQAEYFSPDDENVRNYRKEFNRILAIYKIDLQTE